MHIFSTIFGAVTGFAFLAGPVAAAALPSGDSLGNTMHVTQRRETYSIDMAEACHREHGDTWTAIKKGDHCDQWACLETGTLQELGLDLANFCFQTRGPASYATCKKDAWDWKCITY
jgi:hypothetical protein